MEPVHYIFTRFSVLDLKTNRFASNREFYKSSESEKKRRSLADILFDEHRLDSKFRFFETVTYPSILNQTYKSYIWNIYTANDLPKKYKDRLETHRRANINIIYVHNFPQLERHTRDTIKDKTNFTTMRLDDDDGLFPNFLERLNQYVDQRGKIVSFPVGRRYCLEDGNVKLGTRIKLETPAVGLTAIGFDIFTSGGHDTVREKYQVIEDDTCEMYWLCCSDVCDTKRVFKAS